MQAPGRTFGFVPPAITVVTSVARPSSGSSSGIAMRPIASTSRAAASIALTPSHGREAWHERPVSWTNARTRPRWPGHTSSPVGSPITAADTFGRSGASNSAPRPPVSSSQTSAATSRPRRRARSTPASTAIIAAIDAFASLLPRPKTLPPSTAPSSGSRVQPGPTGTVS